MELVQVLSTVTTERDGVAQTLAKIFEQKGLARQLISFLTKEEIKTTSKSLEICY